MPLPTCYTDTEAAKVGILLKESCNTCSTLMTLISRTTYSFYRMRKKETLHQAFVSVTGTKLKF